MKTLTTHAHCAQLIRKDLKFSFPNIKFKVKTKSYSGGESVSIYYEDGITEKHINDVVSKYQRGNFNGMLDYYEMNNFRNDIPQVKHIFIKRNMSEKTKNLLAKELSEGFRTTLESMMDDNFYHENLKQRSSWLIFEEFFKRNFI